VRIRPARLDETDALTQLALASKRHWGYDDEFMARCTPEMTVHETEVAEGRVFVAAEGDDVPIGFYSLKDLSEGVGELDMLFVTPEHIGEGAGAQLLDHSFEQARVRGWSVMRVESDPFAATFYEHLGGDCVGTARSSSTGRELPLFEYSL
jgi:GNAT superfamily N-acetyltransferase